MESATFQDQLLKTNTSCTISLKEQIQCTRCGQV